MRVIAFVTLLAITAACAPSTQAPRAPATPAPFELARPNVEMRADPAPPFTYWAPEGSVITNHPNVEGIWFADLNGQRVATYFGDQCHASEYQNLLGQPLSTVTSALPADAQVRTICTECARQDDLRRDRINVIYVEATQAVTEISCY